MTAPRFALVATPIEARDLLDTMAAEAVPLRLTKRAEFFLEELIAAGDRGITTIDYPGVRVGDAVHKLRKAGVVIETQYEQHGGEFAGSHGRYVLRSKIKRLSFDGVGIPAPAQVSQAASGATTP